MVTASGKGLRPGWRDAVWVANVEAQLDALWDCHDEGVSLVNAHLFAEDGNVRPPIPEDEIEEWVAAWETRLTYWRNRTEAQLAEFSPLELRRFKNTIAAARKGVDTMHGQNLSVMYPKLALLAQIIEQHQPRVLSE